MLWTMLDRSVAGSCLVGTSGMRIEMVIILVEGVLFDAWLGR